MAENENNKNAIERNNNEVCMNDDDVWASACAQARQRTDDDDDDVDEEDEEDESDNHQTETWGRC